MQQNAFGCYFCPPLSSSTNNMLTKGKKILRRVSLLMFKLKAHRQGRAASDAAGANEWIQICRLGRESDGTCMSPQKEPAFLKSKLCSELLDLKG